MGEGNGVDLSLVAATLLIVLDPETCELEIRQERCNSVWRKPEHSRPTAYVH